MIYSTSALVAFLALHSTALTGMVVKAETTTSCGSPALLTCHPISSQTPTLDANLSDWSTVDGGIDTDLYMALYGTDNPYPHGQMSIKCAYDSSKLYFALEIPGPYRFDNEDNHLCASISTMFKMGKDATFYNMGGCPVAGGSDGCDAGVPEECESYKVDLGGHWELRTTTQGVLYPINVVDKSGNDLVANKDDEYGVGPYCRFDDDDANAGNEWEGAWSYGEGISVETQRAASVSNGTEIMGTYKFEMSRLLATASNITDKQLVAGESYDFGVAYWDPNEVEATGWTDHGHYVTGCAAEWITLSLFSEGGDDSNAASESSGAITLMGRKTMTMGIVGWFLFITFIA